MKEQKSDQSGHLVELVSELLENLVLLSPEDEGVTNYKNVAVFRTTKRQLKYVKYIPPQSEIFKLWLQLKCCTDLHYLQVKS